MSHPIVFFDIAGEDDQRQRDFYASVFGWSADAYGQLTVPVAAPLKGSFRKDPSDKRLYIGVPDINATLTQVASAGGHVEAPRFEVPGVVVLGLFHDPAGNTMGLVEMDGEAPRIP